MGDVCQSGRGLTCCLTATDEVHEVGPTGCGIFLTDIILGVDRGYLGENGRAKGFNATGSVL